MDLRKKEWVASRKPPTVLSRVVPTQYVKEDCTVPFLGDFAALDDSPRPWVIALDV